MTVICTVCGKESRPGGAYCGRCGAALPRVPARWRLPNVRGWPKKLWPIATGVLVVAIVSGLVILLFAGVLQNPLDNGPLPSGRESLGPATSTASATRVQPSPTIRPTATRLPPTATNTPNPDPDADGIIGLADECPTEPETVNKVFDSDGCPDTINDLISTARTLLDEFWAEVFESVEVEYRTASVFLGYTTPIETPCGESLPANAFYCGLSHGIYYDEALFADQLERNGDYAVVFILSHEWGHLVQGLLGTGVAQASIVQELQADCFAGWFASNANTLGILEVGDIEEAAGALFRFGDREVDVLDEEAHGTPGQRIDAFDLGLRDGSCGDDSMSEFAGVS